MRLCKMAKADSAGFWRRCHAQKEVTHGIGREALRQGFAALLGPPFSPPDPVVPAHASSGDGGSFKTFSQEKLLRPLTGGNEARPLDWTE